MVEIIREIRCPYGFGKLFAKIRISGDSPNITPDGLWEIACGDCARDLRKSGEDVTRVLHYFNFEGVYIESEVIH